MTIPGLGDKTLEEHRYDMEQMTQEEMARYWRFQPVGTGYFASQVLGALFQEVFVEKGGMTPEISKRLGW